MAKPDAWMPVYWADLWNDTRGLTAVEQCAYYNLLGSMWVDGGSLPNDNARLQRMARVTEKEWRTVAETVTGYFELRADGRLYQKRLSEEYDKAVKAYAARVAHINKVNSKRSQSKATDDDHSHCGGDSHITHNSHSPNGEHHPSDDGGKPPKSAKGTRLAPDWKPTPEDRTYALDRNLHPSEIDAIAQQFREYWHSADCPRPRKKDWPSTWRRWISRAAPEVIGRRARSGQALGNASRGAGLAAYLRKNLTAEPVSDGPGMHGYRGDVPDESGASAGFGVGESASAEVVDADFSERSSDTPDQTPDPHTVEERDGGGLGTDDGGLPRAASGLSGGRGEIRSDEPTRQPMVADLGGVERAAGDTHYQAPADASGPHELDIPAFLKRTS